MTRAGLFVIGLLLLASSCGKSTPPSTDPTPNSLLTAPKNEYTEYFQDWLKSHEEKNIEVHGAAVTLKGSKALLAARTFQVNTEKGAATVEIEFLISLPDGRIIQDFVAGMGKEEGSAKADAMANFTLTTAHVLYSAFFNSNDDHTAPETFQVQGKTRTLYAGDSYLRGNAPDQAAIEKLDKYLIESFKKATPADDKPHWVKIAYGRSGEEVISSQGLIDNNRSVEFEKALKAAPWPETNSFYLFKKFLLVK